VLTVHPWRFEDRTHAGRELADTLLRSDEQARAVVALSRGGAVVAAEVAEAFGSSLYMLLAGVLERDGRVIGAICEDGTMQLDGQAEPSAQDDVQESARRAQAVLAEQARPMHGHRWVKDGIPGTVLLVSDAILTAAPTIAVAKAIRRRGPHRLIAAAPVASIAAKEAVRPWVDGLVVLQVVEDGIPLERLYCNLAPPSERAIVERLAMTAQWAQALERQP
jgi:predicted phosphoribosyltransferase